ncbi:MAG: hypothetical protein ACI4O7_02965 [Aristaeellaceae bacterium]
MREIAAQGMGIPLLEQAVRPLMTGVMKALRFIRPGMLIEFRQRYVGPCMRACGSMLRVSGCPDATITNRVAPLICA